MEHTKFTATQKTWWIIKGDTYSSAGEMESGSSIETIEELITYTLKSKWEIAKKKLSNLTEDRSPLNIYSEIKNFTNPSMGIK